MNKRYNICRGCILACQRIYGRGKINDGFERMINKIEQAQNYHVDFRNTWVSKQDENGLCNDCKYGLEHLVLEQR